MRDQNGIAAQIATTNGAEYPLAIEYPEVCTEHIDLTPGVVVTLQLYGFVPDSVESIEGALIDLAFGKFKQYSGSVDPFPPISSLDPSAGAYQRTELKITRSSPQTAFVDRTLTPSDEVRVGANDILVSGGVPQSTTQEPEVFVKLNGVKLGVEDGVHVHPILTLQVRNASPYDATYQPHGTVYDREGYGMFISESGCTVPPDQTLDCDFELHEFNVKRRLMGAHPYDHDFSSWLCLLIMSTRSQLQTDAEGVVFASP